LVRFFFFCLFFRVALAVFRVLLLGSVAVMVVGILSHGWSSAQLMEHLLHRILPLFFFLFFRHSLCCSAVAFFHWLLRLFPCSSLGLRTEPHVAAGLQLHDAAAVVQRSCSNCLLSLP
jgi:hypothetical protein